MPRAILEYYVVNMRYSMRLRPDFVSIIIQAESRDGVA